MSPIRVETGPMFSEKTTELIRLVRRELRREKIHGRDFLVFNHASDKRYGANVLASHLEVKVDAFAVHNSIELLLCVCDFEGGELTLKPQFDGRLSTIIIDEAQFFDAYLPNVVEILYNHFEIRDIYLAGLDTDFRGETFGPMGDLMAIAHEVHKHTADCTKRIDGQICGAAATKTQRLVNGQPANYDDPIILVGAKESYTARCDEHHEVPGKPELENLLKR